jgi:hypothetical protein
MNKKDLSAFRRQFKPDSYYLKLKKIYTAYVKKDNQNIMYAELSSFDMKSEAEQEIYLGNFKKLLTGGVNIKLFELTFDDTAPENEGQALCRRIQDAEDQDFVDGCNAYIAKLAENFNYDTDIVVSFAVGSYSKPVGKKGRKGEEESFDGFDDTTYGFKFILCSVSKADSSKRGIFYNAATERFEVNTTLNKDINFSAPIDGFMYPAIGDFGSDVNKILYYTAKAYDRNEALLENVLHCRYELTAREEKERFEEILRFVTGEKIKPEILKNIYEAVNEKLAVCEEEGETATLDAGEIRDIFEECGIEDLSSFEEAYERAAEDGFIFRASSLIGTGARAIRIHSGVSDIDVSLENLGAVRQVINERGRKCLQIELGEDAEINGIALETESLA